MYIHFSRRGIRLINYIKSLFKEPTEIYTARNMKNSHYFLFILSMGILLTLSSLFRIKPEFDAISKDYEEIVTALPDVDLVEGQLESTTGSYIYQTDTLVFYFDPENKIETKLIDKNMKVQTAPISIGLMDQEIYINMLDVSQSYTYSDLNLTTESLQALISLNTFYQPLFYLVTLLVTFLFNLFLYSTQLLSISIFANLISVIGKTGLKFFQNAKIALLASIIPFSVFAVINALQITVSYQYEIISITSLVLFYLSINEFKKRLKEQIPPKTDAK